MSTTDQPHLDLRVEDYLDDKLQSTTDLDTLPTLLASVKAQQSLLQSQLEDAKRDLATARKSSSERQSTLTSKIKTFQNLQSSIDARLKIVNLSDAPNQAVARLQEPYQKRRGVRIAKMYLELLSEVDALRKEARSHLPGDPKAALEPYGRLKRLSISLRELQGPADDAAVHLVTHVTVATDLLWDEMKKTMSKEMEAVLKKRDWPQVDPESEMDDEWIACFEKLLDLQLPELLYTDSVVSLLPFDVMCSIFVSEFRYHFLSDKPTSDPQAISTHCFPWFMALIQKWELFFTDNLGHVLAAKFRDTSVAGRMVYIDPVCAFITSMLHIMREKVKAVVEEAISTPTFLSKFIGELMDFDDNIRSNFNYDGGDANGWPGLTSEVLDNWFEKWFAAEKAFALGRFRGIVESPEGRSIDFDYGGVGKTKPTYGATRVTDMLRQITSQYRRVNKFKHKKQFLIGIQIEVLDEFHDRLRDSLQAYTALTSTVGRTFHGVTKEQQTALEGTGALEALCKVFGSADHVVNTLKDWGNEEFFVELYDELQSRSKSSEKRALSGNVTHEDEDETSTAVGSEFDDGGMFGETIAAYAMRRKAAGDFLVSTLADSHNKAFRAYTSRTQWTPIGQDALTIDPSQLAITPELDEPLRILSRNLDFCLRALGTAALRRTWRLALERLHETLWSDVLMRQNFTALGAAQFARDLEALCALVDRKIPGGSAALANLQEGALLLGLPISKPEGQDGAMTLKEASDRIFTDSSEAKTVLEELGIGGLTPSNARHILQRRVENSE